MAILDEQEEVLLLSGVCKYLVPNLGNVLKQTYFARISGRQVFLRRGCTLNRILEPGLDTSAASEEQGCDGDESYRGSQVIFTLES